jgi:hypothetical protein
MRLLRPHVLADGGALDRRRLEENFLFAARLLAEIPNRALGDKQLERSNFGLATWEEFYAQRAAGLDFVVPDQGYILPDSLTPVVHDDGDFEAKITWSIDVEVRDGLALFAWPTVDGQALWGGMDMLIADQLVRYDLSKMTGTDALDPTTYQEKDFLDADSLSGTCKASLGNTCTVQGRNGRSIFGVAVTSLGSRQFRVKKSTVALRKVLR